MKSFLSKYGHYLFVVLVLIGWIIVGLSGNYFLIISYLIYIALFLGLLNMIKYRHLDLYSVPNSEIKRQIKLQAIITLVVTISFFIFKLHKFFVVEAIIIFVIIFILTISDIAMKISELNKRNSQ